MQTLFMDVVRARQIGAAPQGRGLKGPFTWSSWPGWWPRDETCRALHRGIEAVEQIADIVIKMAPQRRVEGTALDEQTDGGRLLHANLGDASLAG